jgi:hypothetical protein
MRNRFIGGKLRDRAPPTAVLKRIILPISRTVIAGAKRPTAVKPET